MAVITSAVVAVSAAALSMGAVATGIATVATVTTVAAVVGGIGLAVGVVGAVTKNKDLIKVGSIMGALGAGAGIGAMAAGALGLAPTAAASSGGAVAGEAGKSAAVSSTVEAGKAGAGATTQTVSTQAAPNLVNQSVGSTVTGSLPASTTALPGAATGTSALSQSMAGANAVGQVAQNVMPGQGVQAPTPAISGTAAPSAPVTPMAPSAPAVSPVAPAPGGMLSSLDPSTKLMLGLAGTQVVGSTIGGMFQGQSASNALELQKRQMDQDQAQRELINKNNAYAPLLTYGRPSGMVGRA